MKLLMKPQFALIHYFAITAAIFDVSNSQNSSYSLVNVNLYYAALCPDAKTFVGTQLVPTYEDLGNYMNVSYIPYGKATHEYVTLANETGQWNFVCQHGSEGCYGNKAQACAINEILTDSEILNKQQLLVNFVGCSMAADNPAQATPQCLEAVGVDAQYISVVNQCIDSIIGDVLLASHGELTNALVPPLTFVPTIVINWEFTQEHQDAALVDFKSLVCENIAEANRPPACNSSTSLHSRKNILTIAIFSLFFYFAGKSSSYSL